MRGRSRGDLPSHSAASRPWLYCGLTSSTACPQLRSHDSDHFRSTHAISSRLATFLLESIHQTPKSCSIYLYGLAVVNSFHPEGLCNHPRELSSISSSFTKDSKYHDSPLHSSRATLEVSKHALSHHSLDQRITRIYDYLPELQPRHQSNLSSFSLSLTPSISRTCSLLRHETLPIYACSTNFAFTLDSSSRVWTKRLSPWLKTLSPCSHKNNNLARIGSLYLSQHWQIHSPTRWQGHVGFYVKLEAHTPRRKRSSSTKDVLPVLEVPPAWSNRFVESRPSSSQGEKGLWRVTTGTYPVSKDTNGLRISSVELLTSIIDERMHGSTEPGLTEDFVKFVVRAMGIVASHPIVTNDGFALQGHGMRKQGKTWASMKAKLEELNEGTR